MVAGALRESVGLGVTVMLERYAVPAESAMGAAERAFATSGAASTATPGCIGGGGGGRGWVSFQTWTTADSGMRNCHFSAGLSPRTSWAYATRHSRRRSLPEVVLRIDRAVSSTIAEGRTPSLSEISFTTPRRA
eukprot:scaffold250610_cov30-Tisochrysis_lutea.AAC.24